MDDPSGAPGVGRPQFPQRAICFQMLPPTPGCACEGGCGGGGRLHAVGTPHVSLVTPVAVNRVTGEWTSGPQRSGASGRRFPSQGSSRPREPAAGTSSEGSSPGLDSVPERNHSQEATAPPYFCWEAPLDPHLRAGTTGPPLQCSALHTLAIGGPASARSELDASDGVTSHGTRPRGPRVPSAEEAVVSSVAGARPREVPCPSPWASTTDRFAIFCNTRSSKQRSSSVNGARLRHRTGLFNRKRVANPVHPPPSLPSLCPPAGKRPRPPGDIVQQRCGHLLSSCG